jgi:hypothetical protein
MCKGYSKEKEPSQWKYANLIVLVVQDMLKSGEFDIEYCGTNDVGADIITVSFDRQKDMKARKW